MASTTHPYPAAPAVRNINPSGDLFGNTETIPPVTPGLRVPEIIGTGALFKFTSDGGDVDKAFALFSEKLRQSPDDASLMIDIALLHLLKQRRGDAYRLQAEALQREQIFRVVGTQEQETVKRRRVLALVAPGDFMNNAQLEFILDGSDVGLDVLYVVPGKPLPAALPEHDVAFCAVNESDENVPVLRRLAKLLPAWPRPVLNAPQQIQHLSRDGIASLFAGHPNICAPRVSRVGRAHLRRLADGDVALDVLLRGASFPILVRPVGTHCGKNLEKIENPESLTNFMANSEIGDGDFFLAEFFDYRGADGFFRKYRIVLIDGTPFLCHMAVSEEWKIHYVNAGMDHDASKRAQEARAMKSFDDDFAVRHTRRLRGHVRAPWPGLFWNRLC